MNYLDYIREEVRRQGHDLEDPMDGGRRIGWMLEAWIWARRQVATRPRPNVNDIKAIGRYIEPEANAGGFRKIGVRVGFHVAPAAELVPGLVGNLVEHGGELEPLEWYRQFELVHPFVDGNGRTGKVLLAWLTGTFDDPQFPPADLFGDEIANP